MDMGTQTGRARIGSMAWRLAGVPLLALALMAAASDFQAGERGRVASVQDGDSFTLDNGQVVRLGEIEAPRLRQGNATGTQARDALAALVQGREVELRYGGLRRDRRGRALAQVFVAGSGGPVWVQQALLRGGHARVHTYADNRAEVADLWAAEREARRAARGLWTDPAYQVRFATPEALQGGESSFQLMEGQVVRASRRGQVVFLNFGEDAATDVTAVIPESAFARWQGGEDAILALQGRTIRVRGFVRNSNGPSVWVDHPEQIEFIVARAPTG